MVTSACDLFDLASFARHRPWCPEAEGPGDCTCGLYALLDSIRCVCGHKVSDHTDRDVSDVVGWPCNKCKSDRCTGFARADAADAAQQMCDDQMSKANEWLLRATAAEAEVTRLQGRVPQWVWNAAYQVARRSGKNDTEAMALADLERIEVEMRMEQFAALARPSEDAS